MGCSGCFVRRYKRLVNAIFPQAPGDGLDQGKNDLCEVLMDNAYFHTPRWQHKLKPCGVVSTFSQLLIRT